MSGTWPKSRLCPAVSVLSVGRQSRPHMFAAAGSRVFCIADNVVFFGFPRALCLLVSLPFFSVFSASNFNQAVNEWDVARVTSMSYSECLVCRPPVMAPHVCSSRQSRVLYS